jgi:hypothetical protein
MSGGFGWNSAHTRTGWGGYFPGSSGQRMKVDVFDRTYRGGAAQRWQRLSGNGSGAGGVVMSWTSHTPPPLAGAPELIMPTFPFILRAPDGPIVPTFGHNRRSCEYGHAYMLVRSVSEIKDKQIHGFFVCVCFEIVVLICMNFLWFFHAQ